MELNELQKKRLLNATGVLPNNNSLLLNNVNKKKLLDASGSTSSSETLNLVGNKTTDKKKELENTNRNFFQNVLGNVSEWAVGDDADWGTYWERGLGKSNINLMMQYHTKGEKGLNWKDAFKEEPDDTGALERAFETIVGIGADLPTFVAGGAIAGKLTGGNPFAIGFGAGFLNDSIKEMYYQALNKGQVNSFSEWWQIFLQHGIQEGLKGGLVVGSLHVAPLALTKLGLKTTNLNKFFARYTALTGVGSLVEGEMPSWETLQNNAIILAGLGFVEAKASKMVSKSAEKNKTDPLSVVDEIMKNPQMKEDIGSKNQKKFRKDKELDKQKIKQLKKHRNEINENFRKSGIKEVLEEGKTVKEFIQTLKERIEIHKKTIEEAKTTSEKDLAKTNLKVAEKELKQAETGKIIEGKDYIEGLEKKIKELEIKNQDNQVDMNIIKQQKKNNQPFDKEALLKLEKESKEINIELNKQRLLRNRETELVKVELALEELGVKEIKKSVEKEKATTKHKDKDTNSFLKKMEIGKIKYVEKDFASYQATLINRFIDRMSPLKKAVEKAEKAGVKSYLDVYKRMRIQKGMIGRGMHFIKAGSLDFKTLEKNGKSLIEIIKKVVKSDKEYAEFTAFAVAKRALEKHKQGFETPFTGTRADIATAKRIVQKYEAQYGKTFKELVEYQQKVLVYLKDSGIISAELFQKVLELNKDYVPFYRVIDVTLKENIKDVHRLSNVVKNPLKKLKGDTTKPVIDPIESIFLNTLHFVQIAERNYAFSEYIKMVEKLPEIFPEVKEVKSFKRFDLSKEEITKITGQKVSDSMQKTFTIFRRDGQVLTESQIAVFKDGKMKVYEVGAEIATVLKDMNSYQAKMLWRYASVPTRTLRAGATLDPAFIAKNLIRDTFFGAIFSKNQLLPIIGSMSGLFTIIGARTRLGKTFMTEKQQKRSAELYEKWMKSGAMQSQLVSFDRNYFRDGQMVAELTGRTGLVHNVINPKNWLESLRIVSEMVESGARVKDYQLTMKRLIKENEKLPPEKKMTEREMQEIAGFESRDLTIDFRKMGSTMQGYNMISAFFNARVQGLVKIAEAMKNPKRRKTVLLKAGVYITLPSILLWYKNKDSEVYRELPQWQKDLFWIIISNEGTPEQVVWRIPKPFELGWVFGSFPERILDWIYKEDAEYVKQSAGEFSWEMIKSLSPLPDVIRPFIEDATNENFFFNRAIVPYEMEKVLPEFQYTEYTSETSKLIGKAFARLTYMFGGTEMVGPSLDSPAKVDNYLKAWTGGLGTYILNILDYAFTKAGISKPPVKPWSDTWQKNLADIPIIKAFVVRHPSASASYVQKFWKLYRPIKQKHDTYEYLMRQNKVNEALKVWNSIDPALLYLIDMAAPIRELGDVINMIWKLDDIKPNEKRQLIDGFYFNMIDIAKQALKVKKDMDK